MRKSLTMIFLLVMMLSSCSQMMVVKAGLKDIPGTSFSGRSEHYNGINAHTSGAYRDSRDERNETNINPTVNITFPLEDDILSGTITVRGTAFDSPVDSNELIGVEVSLDGVNWTLAEGLASWEFEMNTANLTEGRQTIHARSYDDQNFSIEDRVRVIIDNDPDNTPPSAVISSPSPAGLYSVNETIFFKGDQSSDSDEGPLPLNYTWYMGDGTVRYGVNQNYSYSEKNDLITVALTVYDGDLEDSASLILSVNNIPPVAVIEGGDRTVDPGEPISLNGSGSYDPDAPLDTVTNYTWDMGDGIILYGESVVHIFNGDNTKYQVYLTVRDMNNATGIDGITVTRSNAPPVAQLVIPSYVVKTNVNLFFDGSGSYDPDGSVSSYYFDLGDGNTTGWIDSSSVNHTYSRPGSYSPRLKVMDDQGAQSKWYSSDITVETNPNEPPTLVLDHPAEGAVVSAPVVVRGRAFDDDGDTIQKVEVYFGDVKRNADPRFGGSLESWEAVFENADGLPNGDYTLKVRCFDGFGYSSYESVDVKLNNDPPKDIIVDLEPIPDGFFPGSIITIEGTLRFDTGVTAAESNVSFSLSGIIKQTISDMGGRFQVSLSAPLSSGENQGELTASKGNISSSEILYLKVYKVDFLLKDDNIRIFRGDEEVIGYNDGVVEGETVDLFIDVFFYSDADSGPSIECGIEVAEKEDDSLRRIMDESQISFIPNGLEQSQQIRISWSPLRGNYAIEVELTFGNDTDFSNNNLTKRFTVKAPVKRADFTVGRIIVPEQRFYVDKYYTISAEISNLGTLFGKINLTLYWDTVDTENLILEKRDILIFAKENRTVPLNFRPETTGSVELIIVLDSSLIEESDENNRLSRDIKIYPAAVSGKEDGTNNVLTIAVLGMIIVGVIFFWGLYRERKRGGSEKDEDAGEKDTYGKDRSSRKDKLTAEGDADHRKDEPKADEDDEIENADDDRDDDTNDQNGEGTVDSYGAVYGDYMSTRGAIKFE